MRRASIAVALAAVSALPGLARADEERHLPVQDPGTVGRIAALNKCVSESEYDVPSYYGDNCVRLKIVFGPIVVQPGKNDVLIQPVAFERPMWDGYMVRFKPGLVDATGITPPVEQLHLHHGTWLNTVATYGTGTAWLATGEEKTIASWPYGYGMKISGNTPWLFLHMVHSAVATPTVVYATYDVDYIAASTAEAVQPSTGKALITNTRSIWLDVGGGGTWGGTQSDTSNDDAFPLNVVYNTQAGFGTSHVDTPQEYEISESDRAAYGLGSTALDLCTFPDDNCARENSSGRVSRQQGNDVSGNVAGWDFNVGSANAGTLVVMGGHLHMGGTNDTVSLVREMTDPNTGAKKRFEKVIHVSDAYYWNYGDQTKVGAPPISWDVSMTGVTADIGWRVKINTGDKIRLNADYETDIGSWYENMGIVMTWVAPGDSSGVDPFKGCVYDSVAGTLNGCEVSINHGLLKDTHAAHTPRDAAESIASIAAKDWSINRPDAAPGYTLPGAQFGECVPTSTTLCTRGQVTHGHISTSGNHGGCVSTACDPSTIELAKQAAWLGGDVTEIHMDGFLYVPGDFTQIKATGLPQVKLGDTVTFYNEDMVATIAHTATACGYPCTGPVTTHYPIADGGEKVIATPSTTDDPSFVVVDPSGDEALDTMDFDTTQLGVTIGTPTPAFGLAGGGFTLQPKYELKTTRTGVFTYFCRIHPFMRGAFEVYDPAA